MKHLFRKKFLFDGNEILIERGFIANQADQAFVVKWNQTTILTTLCFSKKPIKSNFLPLTLEFQENLFSVGKIPGSFFRREGRPSEFSILSARIIDRVVRSLFPKNFRHEVQIIVNPLDIDYQVDIRVVAMLATSLVLNVSKLPFNYLFSSVMIGYCDGKFICNPSAEKMQDSSLKLFLAGSETKVNMIEIAAHELPEAKVLEAIKFGHQKIKELLVIQKEILKNFNLENNHQNFNLQEKEWLSDLKKDVLKKFNDSLNKLILITDKKQRQEDFHIIFDNVLSFAKKNYFAKFLKTINFSNIKNELPIDNFFLNKEYQEYYQDFVNDINFMFENCVKQKVRNYTLQKKQRIDQRKFSELRKLSCEIDYLSNVHASAIFSRGDTQTISILTLGTLLEKKMIDDVTKNKNNSFMHHYRSQPFSMGITQRSRGISRREIGHGKLGEKTIRSLLPSVEDFPYTIRIASEVLSSDGSTSQAAICSSSLALMCGGVPLKKPVAGIGIGLIKDEENYHLLTDIQAWEDFYGDMDFKISGTRDGICGVQLDLKVNGLPIEVIEKILEKGKQGRLQILDFMNQKISKSRQTLNANTLKFVKFSINKENIGKLIGPGGRNIKQITATNPGIEIDIQENGNVFLYHYDSLVLEKVKKMCLCCDFDENKLRIGDEFRAKITKKAVYGFFIQLLEHRNVTGLIHNSQLTNKQKTLLKVDDKITVKYLGINEKKKTVFKLI